MTPDEQGHDAEVLREIRALREAWRRVGRGPVGQKFTMSLNRARTEWRTK